MAVSVLILIMNLVLVLVRPAEFIIWLMAQTGTALPYRLVPAISLSLSLVHTMHCLAHLIHGRW